MAHIFSLLHVHCKKQFRYLPMSSFLSRLRRHKLLLAFLPALIFLFCSVFYYEINHSFVAFCDTVFRNEITENTLNLHYTLENPEILNLSDPDVSFGSMNPEVLADSFSQQNIYLEKLFKFPKDWLSTKNRLTYDILTSAFSLQAEGEKYLLYDEPLGPSLGTQAASHIAQAGLRLQEAEDYIQSQVQKLAERYVHYEEKAEPEVFLEREGFCRQEHLMQEYLIRFCLEKMIAGQKDVSRRHIGALLELAAGQNGKSLNLPGGIRAVNKNEFLVFEKNRSIRKKGNEAAKCRGENLQIPGVTGWRDLRITADVFSYEKQIIPQKKCTKWFDYDTINHRLEIRTRQAGDTLSVHAEGGTKPLKRYMIDEKILRERRDEIPLIADGSHILWVVGYRISEAYKVTERTKRILQIQIDKEN